MYKLSSLILIMCFWLSVSHAQQDIFVGSFTNAQKNVSLRMKPVQGEYHGVVQSKDGVFAISAKKVGQQLSGIIYTQASQIDFQIVPQNGVLAISTMGNTEWYYRISSQHELAGIDLTPYMTAPANTDYDYGYTQHNGNESERYRTYPNTQAGRTNPNAYNDPQLFQLIAGSQVVIYNRTSYLNDNTASSLTYVNYCSNGRFSISYDGSFATNGGGASGASRSQNSGRWQLMAGPNGPQIQLQYNNGKVEQYPVYKNYLLQGRWRIGNTQYAIQRNKAVCH